MIPSGTSRGFFYVKGLLAGERIDLVVCHLPSQLNSRAGRLRAAEALRAFVAQLEADPEARVVVIGDMNAAPGDRTMSTSGLHAPLLEVARRGGGSYVWDGRWLLYDHIWVGDPLAQRVGESGVFIRDYLLQSGRHPRPGQPLRSFSGRTYLGGYSDHLPVFIHLNEPKALESEK